MRTRRSGGVGRPGISETATGGGVDGTMPPPVPRGAGGSGGRGGDRRVSEEGLVDSGEDYGNMASPAGIRLGGGGRGGGLLSTSSSSSSPSPGSNSKRKRSAEGREGDVMAVKAAAAAAAVVAEERIEELRGELAAEKTRCDS